MPLLLDTHAFAWKAFDEQRLSHDAFEAIQPDESFFVSPVVAWEVAGKVRSGEWPEAEELSR